MKKLSPESKSFLAKLVDILFGWLVNIIKKLIERSNQPK